MKLASRSAGFLLFETMIAVAIFAIGVVALGRCVENCLNAEMTKEIDNRARRALENEMAMILAGAKPLSNEIVEEMKGMFEGLTMKITRVPVKEKNEKNPPQDIVGIFEVTLEVSWKGKSDVEMRDLQFYFQPKQR